MYVYGTRIGGFSVFMLLYSSRDSRTQRRKHGDTRLMVDGPRRTPNTTKGGSCCQPHTPELIMAS